MYPVTELDICEREFVSLLERISKSVNSSKRLFYKMTRKRNPENINEAMVKCIEEIQEYFRDLEIKTESVRCKVLCMCCYPHVEY